MRLPKPIGSAPLPPWRTCTFALWTTWCVAFSTTPATAIVAVGGTAFGRRRMGLQAGDRADASPAYAAWYPACSSDNWHVRASGFVAANLDGLRPAQRAGEGTPPAAGIGQPAQFIPACPDSVVVLESPCPISPTMPFAPSAGATRSQLARCVDLALAQGVQAEAMAVSTKARAARDLGCHSPPRPRRSDRSRSPARNVSLVGAALSPPGAVLPARASCETSPVGFRGEGFPPDQL